jgi:hypothetical protein
MSIQKNDIKTVGRRNNKATHNDLSNNFIVFVISQKNIVNKKHQNNHTNEYLFTHVTVIHIKELHLTLNLKLVEIKAYSFFGQKLILIKKTNKK